MSTITKRVRAPKPKTLMPWVDIANVLPAITSSFRGIDDRDRLHVYASRESCGGILAAVALERWNGWRHVPGQYIVFVRADGTVTSRQTHWDSVFWIGVEAFNAFDPVTELGAVSRTT